MRAHLHLLARWSRLLLACLAVGSTVSPAQVASAAQAITIREGGPGKPPVVAAPCEQQRVHAVWRPVSEARRSPALFVPSAPRAAGPLFLLHRALLR